MYRNPTDAVTAPRPKKQALVTLSAEQARLFLRSVSAHPLYPLYVLALTTGMRKGELLGLSWENCDLENGSLSVVNTLVTIQGQQSIGTPKSSSAKRKIKLTEFAVEALKQHQLQAKNLDGLVFITSAGTPYSQRNLTRHFHNALEKAGLPRIRFHDLRHTAATLMLQLDVHPKVVQEILGHSTIVLTLDTYSHTIPSMQGEAVDKMDEVFA
jgi:integrase